MKKRIVSKMAIFVLIRNLCVMGNLDVVDSGAKGWVFVCIDGVMNCGKLIISLGFMWEVACLVLKK